jgi:hypothetical protein
VAHTGLSGESPARTVAFVDKTLKVFAFFEQQIRRFEWFGKT